MNDDFLISQLAGQWIVQSTSYSLLKHADKNIFINQMRWTRIKDCSPYLKCIAQNLEKQDILTSVYLYYIELKNNNGIDCSHYIALVYERSRPKLVIKFSRDFVFLNKFIVQSQSNNSLTIMSYDNNIKIVERIYFLNRNLKVVKSTIQKYSTCVGTCFSSEIRIS